MRLSIPYDSAQVMGCWLDSDIDRIEVQHLGDLTWDELQKIKNLVWGEQACAIEIYPPQPELVNGGNYRHLWKLEKATARTLPSLVDEGART